MSARWPVSFAEGGTRMSAPERDLYPHRIENGVRRAARSRGFVGRSIEQKPIPEGGCPYCARVISISPRGRRRHHNATQSRGGVECVGSGLLVDPPQFDLNELPPVEIRESRESKDDRERERIMRAERKARLAERAAEVRAKYGVAEAVPND